jgi:hypothetical protein
MHGTLNFEKECFAVRVVSDHQFEHNYVKTEYTMKIYSEQRQGEA